MSSGFKSAPPRVLIREYDNRSGDSPLAARSGQVTGVTSSFFDDTRTVIFTSATSSIIAPVGLQSGSVHIDPQLPPFINLSTGYVTKGVAGRSILRSSSSHRHSPFKENWRPEQSTASFYSGSHVFDRKLSSKSSFTVDISNTRAQFLCRSPKLTNNVFDPAGRFYNQDLTGFCYYNFDTKRWDQIGLTDPETGNSLKFDYRISSVGGTIYSGTSRFPYQFCSLDNFGAGLDDGSSYDTVPKYLTASVYPNGSSSLMTENQRLAAVDIFKKLPGSPTVTLGAPFYNIYHATGSQRIRMSKYINRPFVLEKVVVNLEISAEKTGSRTDTYSSYDKWQDDLIFFMYRQTNSPWQDLYSSSLANNYRTRSEFVTSSERSLICSGVITFYDGIKRFASRSANGLSMGYFTDTYTPFNSPSMAHDWGFSAANVVASSSIIKTFSGSVEVRCDVAVPAKNLFGAVNIPTVGGDPLGPPETGGGIDWSAYWPGGSSCIPFGPTGSTGKPFLAPHLSTLTINQPSFSSNGYGYTAFAGVYAGSDLRAFEDQLPIFKYDPRLGTNMALTSHATRGAGGFSSAYVTLQGEQSRKTHYVLLPTDELIFGLQSNISHGYSAQVAPSGSISFITGTLFKIQTGEMSVTFYGEYVKAGEYEESIRFENLTSPSVSSFIGEEIYDEFDVRGKETSVMRSKDFSMVGTLTSSDGNSLQSYRRRYFSDIMTTRYIVSPPVYSYDYFYYNQGQPTTVASFNDSLTMDLGRRSHVVNRFITSERFYDTLFPSLESVITACGAITTGSYVYDMTPTLVTYSSSTLGRKIYKFVSSNAVTESGNSVLTANSPYLSSEGYHDALEHIYASGLDRVDAEKDDFLLLARTAGSQYTERCIYDQALRWLLLSRGLEFYPGRDGPAIGSLGSSNNLQHAKTGSWGFRYGIHSVLPSHTSQVYRHNKYGQFRDRLEQRLFSVHYIKEPVFVGKTEGPVDVRFFNSGTQVLSSNSFLSGSSNRSIFATSSRPYRDGETSNWGTVL